MRLVQFFVLVPWQPVDYSGLSVSSLWLSPQGLIRPSEDVDDEPRAPPYSLGKRAVGGSACRCAGGVLAGGIPECGRRCRYWSATRWATNGDDRGGGRVGDRGSPVHADRPPPPAAPLEVSLRWEQTGSWLDGELPSTRTISEAGTAEVEAATEDDQVDDEPNGEVNVTVNSGRGYRVGDPNKATVAVTDNETSMRVERITPNPMRNPWPCDCGGSKTVTVRVRFDPPTIEQVNYRLMVTEVIMYSISGRFSEVRHFDRTVAAGTSTDEFPVEYPIRDPRGTAQTGNGVDRRYYFGTENQSGYGNGGEKSVSIRWIIYGPARARRASAT